MPVSAENFPPVSPSLNDTTFDGDFRISDRSSLGFIIAILLTNSLGVVGNGILLLSLVIYKPLRRSASCSLMAHCVAIDLYSCAIAVPSSAIPFFLGPNYDLPVKYCHYQPVVNYFTLTLGMYATCILAVHRLVATILPHQFVVLTNQGVLLGNIYNLHYCHYCYVHDIMPRA